MDRTFNHIYCLFLACALSALATESVASVSGCEYAAADAIVTAQALDLASPLIPEPPKCAGLTARLAAISTAIIVRWEVGSPSLYTRRYQGVYWPGGASGPTWGIGYDGGHQSPAAIERDWSAHASKLDLVKTAGITGKQAQLAIARWRGITTPFSLAQQVFAERSLPGYALLTQRAYGRDFDTLPEPTQAALISLTYNRGGSMLGSRNHEKRVIKNECLQRRDAQCVAQQLQAMCRLWENTPNYNGLCGRRIDEAKLAVQI